MGVLPNFSYRCLVLRRKDTLFYGEPEPKNITKSRLIIDSYFASLMKYPTLVDLEHKYA